MTSRACWTISSSPLLDASTDPVRTTRDARVPQLSTGKPVATRPVRSLLSRLKTNQKRADGSERSLGNAAARVLLHTATLRRGRRTSWMIHVCESRLRQRPSFLLSKSMLLLTQARKAGRKTASSLLRALISLQQIEQIFGGATGTIGPTPSTGFQ